MSKKKIQASLDKRPSFADFFAGAGGLSEGLTSAGLRPIAHVEANPHACMTLKTRAAYRALLDSGNMKNYNAYMRGRLTQETLHRACDEGATSDTIEQTISESTEASVFHRIERQLKKHGCTNVLNLEGGILAYGKVVDPSLSAY